MLIPKANRRKIYEYLFKEGVLVAKKDFSCQHPRINVPNLQVIKAMQSFESRGFVKEQFAWRHYYWYLQNEGINYLREYLHLPSDIVPNTLKRPVRSLPPSAGAPGAPGGGQTMPDAPPQPAASAWGAPPVGGFGGTDSAFSGGGGGRGIGGGGRGGGWV